MFTKVPRSAAGWLIVCVAACGQVPVANVGDDVGTGSSVDTFQLGPDAKAPKDVTTDTGAPSDVFLVVDVGQDLVAGTDAATPDVEPDAAEDATSPADTKDAVDAGALLCPGAAGCACATADDCDNQACITTATGKICAVPCSSACPDGFACGTWGTGADATQYCLPKFTTLCDPCLITADCQSVGATQPRCVDRGAEGRFCGAGCAADSDCPASYVCVSAKTAEGDKAKQCVPAGGAACACSAEAEGKSTPCQANELLDNGKQVTCIGSRTCSQGVLTACTADKPGAEVCDGKDNDCNGLTDDGVAACDDANPCTSDACAPTTPGVPSTCAHTPVPDGGACNDDKCWVGRVCVAGTCAQGTPKVCADANAPCLVGTCDSKTGCGQVTADGEVCSDGDPCTKGDVCAGGECTSGKPKVCDDQDACTIDKCDKTSGTCAFVAVPAGTPCDDGNQCSTGDACTAVGCLGSATKDCSDGNPCTADSCSPVTGCTYNNTAGPCDDGDACTSADACSGGTCAGTPFSASACDDDNPCTADTCNPNTGCGHKPQTGPCDDGNACTANDFCQSGACQSGGNVCTCTPGDASSCAAYEDGNACNGTLQCVSDKGGLSTCQLNPATVVTCDASANTTCSINTCDPKSGKCAIVSVTDGTPCDADKNACTVGDGCAGGVCLPGAVTPNCDDGNPCTTDACLPASGCSNTANAQACDDGSACTTNDQCASGSCMGGPALNCDDGNDCTVDSCAAGSGCGHASAPGGTVCDDGNPCTTTDTCVGSGCVGTGALPCSDGDPCTADSCAVGLGCAHTATTGPCNDGDLCTTGETCAGGSCGGGSAVPCVDGNPCTLDGCDKLGGCTFTWQFAACDDNSACTQNDVCSKGVCAGTAMACSDGKPCTVDSCDPASGCVFSPGTGACDDGDPCTTVDACSGGVCLGSGNKDCSDNNACTDDACTPGFGCTHTNNTAACSDNDPCTTVDLCNNGACLGNGALNCNDGNACTSDSCAKGYGCVYGAVAGACNDGDPCTTTDTCSGTTCVGSGSLTCNDNNACTNDSCKTGTGCVFANNSASCNDGDACSLTDGCVGGACTGLTYKNCSDGNPCTLDTCSGGTCSHPYDNYNWCATGDPCTINDYCYNGTCLKGPPDTCDDYNACTTDSCDPVKGCQHVANTASCDDGDPCTINDVCAAKKCTAGTAKDCSAQSGPCSTGYCDYYGTCQKQLKYGGSCTLNTSAGTCDYSGNCQPTYSVDGCTGAKFVSSCVSGSCDACVAECLECASPGNFHAVNETGCSGASCFTSHTAPSSHGLNNDTGAATGLQAMRTNATQSAYAEWVFPNTLQGSYQLQVWIPDPKWDNVTPPAGCAKWNYTTNAVYRIYKGATLWKSVTIDQSWGTYYGSYTSLYYGDCTGVTKVVVTNAASPTSCGFVLLDELKASPW